MQTNMILGLTRSSMFVLNMEQTGDRMNGLSFQDIHQHSYWLDGLDPAPETTSEPPAQTDVAIIGSGYTGLNAAIECARGGRSVVVLEAGDPGKGCSTRNGGQISTSIKPTYEALTRKFGAERARAIRNEGARSLEWIGQRVAEEKIDCDYAVKGRYHAAHTPQHYEALAREVDHLGRTEGMKCHMVPRETQRSELGSDVYFGGAVYADHAALHPAKYHRGLLRVALAEGVQVVGECAATGIQRLSDGFEVQSEKGTIRARDVIVATNGYTTSLTPWFQRRVIPIASNIIATEPLPADLVDTLFPTDRIASDTCKVVYYYRASPDRKRIVFGGRVAAREIGVTESAARLYEKMCQTFPELRAYGVTHSWSGTVAYTFDELAHIGQHDGVHYAMGYCGSGVAMASYLGMRVGNKVLGLKAGDTAFDGLPHPTRPLYRGTPWFLPAAVAWYRWKDRKEHNRALANA